MRKLFSVSIASIVLAALIPVSPATSANCWSYSAKERAFAKKINSARGRHDARRLSLDPELSKVAMKQTKTMIKKRLLHHTPNLGRRVTRWTMLGENVGYGGTVGSLHKTFMRSAPHKRNILTRQFKYVGVGAKKAHGYLWVTVVFQAKRNPGTTLRMPKC
ncbi:MAG TPA: CAP domain-containing protein [Actinomycetota bacterium]|nr:CAP domain-containing protein [Actinomycetota bacterium]